MNANELMINDLVKYDGTTYKVDALYRSNVFVSLFPCVVKKEDNVLMPLSAKLNDINPIPLTTDMFKENGFVYDKYDYCYRLEGSDIGFEIGKVELYEGGCQGYSYIVYECEFVHQLQNFLRCCGMIAFADNFKI